MVLVLLATAAAQALLFAASPPASASPLFTGHIRETFGSYSVGAPSIALYDPVMETTSGRVIDIVAAGNYRKLEFDADTTKCVAAANNGADVVVHPCDGSGVDWAIIGLDSSHYAFQNREFNNKYLAGANNGTQFQLKTWGQNGWYYNFRLTS